MERSSGVNAAAYAGAALSGVLLTCVASEAGAPPGSSAYLPMPLAVAISGNRAAFAHAAAVAFTVPFIGTFVSLRAAGVARGSGAH